MNLLRITGVFIIFTAIMSSCTFDQVEPKPADFVPPDEPISYSADIQPIFTSKCIACHPPTQNLDLNPGVSYSQIGPGTKYTDLGSPDQSLIYLYPNPTSASHTYRKYSDKEAFLVLTWIEEGAQDN